MSEMRFVGPFERVLYLKQLPGLGEISYGELAMVAHQFVEIQAFQGEKLLSEDEIIEWVYILVEGHVRIEKDGELDSEYGPKDGVGFMHWLANVEGGVDAIAETDIVALRIPTKALLEILEDHFSFYLTIVKTLAASVYDQLKMTPDGTVKKIWDDEMNLPERPLDLVERIVLLRKSPMMENVGLDTIANLATFMEEREFEVGAKIWKAGDVADGVKIILSGRVRCSIPSMNTQFFAESGYPMGNSESVAGKPRWYDAVAETDTRVLAGNTSRLLDALEDHFDMAMTFLRIMAKGYLSYSRQNLAKPAKI